jgi:hypothetical protein
MLRPVTFRPLLTEGLALSELRISLRHLKSWRIIKEPPFKMQFSFRCSYNAIRYFHRKVSNCYLFKHSTSHKSFSLDGRGLKQEG